MNSRDRDTWEQWWKQGKPNVPPPPKPPKYHAQPVKVDDLGFDSKREAARYQELKLMQAAGLISDLEVHPGFPLQVMALHRDGPPWNIETVGMYHADFKYRNASNGEIVIEDIKSPPTRTTAYKLRKRIAEAVHGITITEIE